MQGFYGNECKTTIQDKIGVFWWVYVACVTFVFLVLGLFASAELFLVLRLAGWSITPTKLLIGLVVGQSTARVIYYGVDAHAQLGIWDKYSNAFIYETGIWPLYILYGVLLYYRISISKRIRRSVISWKFRIVALGIALGWIALEYAFVLGVVLQTTGLLAEGLYHGFILLGVIVLFFIMFLNGRHLYTTIRDHMFSEEAVNFRQTHLQKIQRVLTTLACFVAATVVIFIVLFIVEWQIFHLKNPWMLIAKDFLFRVLELCYCTNILYSLKDATSNLRLARNASTNRETVELPSRTPTSSLFESKTSLASPQTA